MLSFPQAADDGCATLPISELQLVTFGPVRSGSSAGNESAILSVGTEWNNVGDEPL